MKDGRIYDGGDVAIGCDTDTHPSYLPPTYDAESINRSMRGGIRRTRPPFAEIEISVLEGEDKSIIEEFQSANWQGGMIYQSVKIGTSDGIIASAAGKIYFLAIVGNRAYLRAITDGNDPSMLHTWFVQAEEWVYIQNGSQNPIAWGGDSTGAPSNLRTQGLGSPSTIGSEITTTTRERSGGIVTLTFATPHTYSVDSYVIVEGLGGVGYNGTFRVIEIPSFTQIKYQTSGTNQASTADTGGTARAYIGESLATWNLSSENETDVEVQLRSNFGAWKTIATLPPKTSEYKIRGLNPDQNNEVRVRVVFGIKTSPWSSSCKADPNDSVKTPEFPKNLSRLNPEDGEMPIGTIMEYAYGRVWVSDKLNNIYASDIIFGDGFTNTGNTRKFTEQTYWAEGGSFTPPSNLGSITGMRVVPSININDRGQGELVILCDKGAFTINGSISRTDWALNNIQKVSLTGRGCRSPWSVCGVNNEIFFRSDDGWSFYSNSQIEFQRSMAFRKFSKEVDKWVNGDTPWLQQFASAIYFDNRIIATVSPYIEKNLIEGQGDHRPHNGMVVLDLDQSTITAPDAQYNFRWNGLWLGPKPIQLLAGNIGGVRRAFAISRSGGKNRIFEFLKEGVDDWTIEGPKKIKSLFITKRYDFSGSNKSNKYYRKSFNGGDIWVSEINEKVKLSIAFRPDSYECWTDILRDKELGCDDCGDQGCEFDFSQARYARLRFPTPSGKECQVGVGISTTEGAEFQILFEAEGSVTVDRIRISADTRQNMEDPTGDCPDKKYDCTPIVCCPISDFDYYSL